MVIGLSHLGYYPNEATNLRHIGDEGLARRIPELDLIVGAHTHTELREAVRIGQTAIVQAGAEGHFVGRVDVDLAGPRPVITNSQLLPVRNLPQDPEVRRITETYLSQSREQLKRRVGTTRGEFPGGRALLGTPDAPLGNLVAEAIRLEVGADISVANARGLRAGLPNGEVTYRDILSVSPFGNTLTQVDLNGQELWRLMEIINRNYLSNQNENMFFSRGFEIEFENNRIKAIRLNGVDVPNSPSGRYRLAANNFLPEMVTDFAFIRNNPTYTQSRTTEVAAIEGYFRRHPVVRADQLRHENLLTSGRNSCSRALLGLLRAVRAQ
jgi:5'-nucleotidase/UDP-sugar diphosphatase